MKIIIINTVNDKIFDFYKSGDELITILNVYELSNIKINTQIDNIINLRKINNMKDIEIIFDKTCNSIIIDKMVAKLHDKLYTYYPKELFIKISDPMNRGIILYDELNMYKDIIMNPNKTPTTYVEYVTKRIPSDYIAKIFTNDKNIKGDNISIIELNDNLFPLSGAVNMGSRHPMYFVHILPKQLDNNKKNIYLIGKAVTFDSGGMNLKSVCMEDMKIDMTGSAIILSVLNLLNKHKLDNKYNINLLIPIVENMIDNTAIRPGMVVTTMCGKKVEITDTDAEGRLCIADALEYIHKYLIKSNRNNHMIFDIATLTGNASLITGGISSICLSNKMGYKYFDKLASSGELINEYVDYLKLRPEYNVLTNSKVADIKNLTRSCRSGCVLAAVFLNYFCKDSSPWIHLDVAANTFDNDMTNSYGVNLLYYFLTTLEL